MLQAPAEHGFARLKTWRVLGKVRTDPNSSTPKPTHARPATSNFTMYTAHRVMTRRSGFLRGFVVGAVGQSGRGQSEVLGQYLGRGVGVAGQRGFLQSAVLAHVVPVGVAVR